MRDGIPNTPNGALLMYYNDPASPKQKKAIALMSGLGYCPPEIKTKGGASLVIQALRKVIMSKGVVSQTPLPAEAFCQKFNESGKALLSTIVDPKFKDGVALSFFKKSAEAFDNVVKAPATRVTKGNMPSGGTVEVKPQVVVEEDPFGEILVVRRHRTL